MFSGINQSGMFTNVNFMSSYWKNSAVTGSQNGNSSTEGTESTATENGDSQKASSREEFINILKEKGMSEDAIASLPDKLWKRAEEKAEHNKNYDFGSDKMLQKLADFLAKKSELMQSQQDSNQTSGDSANISQEALEAAANADSEAEETDEEATGAQNYASIFDEFKDKLNQVLLEGPGIGRSLRIRSQSLHDVLLCKF